MKRLLSFLLALTLVFLLAACGGASPESVKEPEPVEEPEPADPVEEYKDNLSLARDKLQSAMNDARITVGLISTVMSNAFDKTYDEETAAFTTLYGTSDGPFVSPDEAVTRLFDDEDFQKELAALEESKNELAELEEALRDPPEQFEQAHAAFQRAYMAYQSLASQAAPSDNVILVMMSFINASTECRESLAALDDCLTAVGEAVEEAAGEAAG